ncbi:Uncharacterised protein [Sphingobacterium daejeonense]|nr:Uncharacterised protein [Sphingobacterium daejeonense]
MPALLLTPMPGASILVYILCYLKKVGGECLPLNAVKSVIFIDAYGYPKKQQKNK